MILIKNLSKSFGNQKVLTNFSAQIPIGKVTALMGSSGCGKTTLFNILMGLLPADHGSVQGLESARIAAVFQENRLCNSLDALNNVALVCTRSSALREKITQAFFAVGLDYAALSKPVSQLSGGMQRRVAIVRAVLFEADTLFLDEPFKGLDDQTQEIVSAWLKATCAGKTILMITHDMRDVHALATSVIDLGK